MRTCAVFYDLWYRCDVFTHKSHRMAIELSQSTRSNSLDPSSDGYSRERFTRARASERASVCLRARAHICTYIHERTKKIFVRHRWKNSRRDGGFGNCYWDHRERRRIKRRIKRRRIISTRSWYLDKPIMGKPPSLRADLKLQQLTLLFRQTRPGFWLAAMRDRAEKRVSPFAARLRIKFDHERGFVGVARFARRRCATKGAMSIEITSVPFHEQVSLATL